jgi:hypothetical protein
MHCLGCEGAHPQGPRGLQGRSLTLQLDRWSSRSALALVVASPAVRQTGHPAAAPPAAHSSVAITWRSESAACSGVTHPSAAARRPVRHCTYSPAPPPRPAVQRRSRAARSRRTVPEAPKVRGGCARGVGDAHVVLGPCFRAATVGGDLDVSGHRVGVRAGGY